MHGTFPMMAFITESHKRFIRQNGTHQQFKNKTGPELSPHSITPHAQTFITHTVLAFDFGNSLFQTAHRCNSIVV